MGLLELLPDELLPRVLLFAAYYKSRVDLMLTCRSFRAACRMRHLPEPHLVLVGGSSNQMGHNATEVVRCLSLTSPEKARETWLTGQWRSTEALDDKRSHMACAVVNEKLFVIGGTTLKAAGGHRALR